MPQLWVEVPVVVLLLFAKAQVPETLPYRVTQARFNVGRKAAMAAQVGLLLQIQLQRLVKLQAVQEHGYTELLLKTEYVAR